MSMETSKTSTMHAEQEENTENRLGKQKAKCNLHSKRNRCNNNVIVASIIAIVVTMHHAVDASPSKDVQPSVKINKCCEKFEIYVDSRCTIASKVNESEFYSSAVACFMIKLNLSRHLENYFERVAVIEIVRLL